MRTSVCFSYDRKFAHGKCTFPHVNYKHCVLFFFFPLLYMWNSHFHTFSHETGHFHMWIKDLTCENKVNVTWVIVFFTRNKIFFKWRLIFTHVNYVHSHVTGLHLLHVLTDLHMWTQVYTCTKINTMCHVSRIIMKKWFAFCLPVNDVNSHVHVVIRTVFCMF